MNKKLFYFILLVFFSCKVGENDCIRELKCQSGDIVLLNCDHANSFAKICIEKYLALRHLRNHVRAKHRQIRSKNEENPVRLFHFIGIFVILITFTLFYATITIHIINFIELFFLAKSITADEFFDHLCLVKEIYGYAYFLLISSLLKRAHSAVNTTKLWGSDIHRNLYAVSG